MAKKVTGMIKLQIPAGQANPAPPVGPALGQHGVNIMAFCKEFNAATKNDAGLIIPVRSEEHTSELQSQSNLVCRLLLEKKKTTMNNPQSIPRINATHQTLQGDSA